MLTNHVNQTALKSNTVSTAPIWQDEIQAAQHEIESALQQQTDVEQQIIVARDDLKQLQVDFDRAGRQARRAFLRLRNARIQQSPAVTTQSADSAYTSDLDRVWEARLEAVKAILRDEPTAASTPFPQSVAASSQPITAASTPKCSAAPNTSADTPVRANRRHLKPRDAGADLDLSVLMKGPLQSYIQCRPGLGLTLRQVERLKDAVDGNTIGDLERFQRETPHWETSIPGFGPGSITRLQDAQVELRDAFPIPSPELIDANDELSSEFEIASRTGKRNPGHVCSTDQAETWLTELIERCHDVEQQITNLEGVRFLRDVTRRSLKLLEQIQLANTVTAEQHGLIQNWQTGVEAWNDSLTDLEFDADEVDAAYAEYDSGDTELDDEDEIEPDDYADDELENDDLDNDDEDEFDEDEYSDGDEDDFDDEDYQEDLDLGLTDADYDYETADDFDEELDLTSTTYGR